jgi:sigma-B regulation protein RsbU (phosphoserine phosphatase)
LYEPVPVKPGFVLGGIENRKYTEASTLLLEGDVLFMYTDGLTEASNSDQTMFGPDRVLDTLNSGPKQDIKSLVLKVRHEADAFSGGEEQFDDMTMLALIFKEPSRNSAPQER